MQSDTPPLSQPPSLLQRLADRLATRLQRLAASTSTYTIARGLPVPMRDGVVLRADLYTPTKNLKGTLLVRSPYGWQLPFAVMTGGVYASRGYRVILARCRGTFGSGGNFDPMRREVDDGLDTVAWMRTQAWFDGRFATFGGSYLGFTQWALLMEPPPELVTAVISVGPHDFFEAIYQDGAFNLGDFLGWADQMAHQEEPVLRRLWSMVTAGRRQIDGLQGLPLVAACERVLAGRSLWFRDWVSRRNAADPMWTPMKLAQALDRVQVPVLLQGGWQDLFLQQTLQQYAHLRRRGVDVALTVGPWTHGELVTKGGSLIVGETLDWFNEHLAGGGSRSREEPVRVFVTGADSLWCDYAVWPPATQMLTIHLDAHGLLDDQPCRTGVHARFTYDPANATPAMGGRVLLGGGYVEDRALAGRKDVLVFTGPFLTAPLEVHGNPIIALAHSTDNPHADLFVRLCEVDVDGRSRNVSDGYARLDPAAANGMIRIGMDAIAHRFTPGNRIRVVIAGGSHPHWERNLGTSEDPANSSRMRPSKRTIELAPSHLLLPVAKS
jgi:uncharacterized protein